MTPIEIKKDPPCGTQTLPAVSLQPPIDNLIEITDKKASPSTGRTDPAYEIFAQEFKARRTIPYRKGKGDFEQLAALRKALSIASKETPQGWERAVSNFFDSPRDSYHLCYFCSHYDTFLISPIDRFGKPVAHEPRQNNGGSVFDSFIAREEVKRESGSMA